MKFIKIGVLLKVLLLFIVFVKNNASKSELCDYVHLKMTGFEIGTDKVIDEKEIEACWKSEMIDPELKMIKISSEESDLTISYLEEDNKDILRFLNIGYGSSEPSRWRASQGHDLFIINKVDRLIFIFGDRKKTKVKGTIELIRG